jgi:hypothetical protein
MHKLINLAGLNNLDAEDRFGSSMIVYTMWKDRKEEGMTLEQGVKYTYLSTYLPTLVQSEIPPTLPWIGMLVRRFVGGLLY